MNALEGELGDFSTPSILYFARLDGEIRTKKARWGRVALWLIHVRVPDALGDRLNSTEVME